MTVLEFLTQNNLTISEIDVVPTTTGNDIIFNIICDGTVHELEVDYTNIVIGSVLNRSLNFSIVDNILSTDNASIDLTTTNMLNTSTNGLV